MRECMTYKYVPKEGKTPYPYDRVEAGKGRFHQWGCNFEEFDGGPGNFSTAIVEMTDGEIKNIPAEDIVFLQDDY